MKRDFDSINNEPRGPPPSGLKSKTVNFQVTLSQEPSGPPPSFKSYESQLNLSGSNECQSKQEIKFELEEKHCSVYGKLKRVVPCEPPIKKCRVFEEENVETHAEEEDVKEEEEEEEEGNKVFHFETPKFISTIETDPQRLFQRQKQIELGKNTVGYQNYRDQVPTQYRQKYNKIHPVTPNIHEVVSKRAFEGKVKAWRRLLHFWDVLPGEELKERVNPIQQHHHQNRKQQLSTTQLETVVDTTPVVNKPIRETDKFLMEAEELFM